MRLILIEKSTVRYFPCQLPYQAIQASIQSQTDLNRRISLCNHYKNHKRSSKENEFTPSHWQSTKCSLTKASSKHLRPQNSTKYKSTTTSSKSPNPNHVRTKRCNDVAKTHDQRRSFLGELIFSPYRPIWLPNRYIHEKIVASFYPKTEVYIRKGTDRRLDAMSLPVWGRPSSRVPMYEYIQLFSKLKPPQFPIDIKPQTQDVYLPLQNKPPNSPSQFKPTP